jgi:hypothetical protein
VLLSIAAVIELFLAVPLLTSVDFLLIYLFYALLPLPTAAVIELFPAVLLSTAAVIEQFPPDFRKNPEL